MDSSGMEYARECNDARRSEAASPFWRTMARTTSRTTAGPEASGAAAVMAVMANRFIVTGGAAAPGHTIAPLPKATKAWRRSRRSGNNRQAPG